MKKWAINHFVHSLIWHLLVPWICSCHEKHFVGQGDKLPGVSASPRSPRLCCQCLMDEGQNGVDGKGLSLLCKSRGILAKEHTVGSIYWWRWVSSTSSSYFNEIFGVLFMLSLSWTVLNLIHYFSLCIAYLTLRFTKSSVVQWIFIEYLQYVHWSLNFQTGIQWWWERRTHSQVDLSPGRGID